MQRNSQELPSSPTNRTSTNSKRNFIRKEIDITNPKTLPILSNPNKITDKLLYKSQENRENSPEISSIDNEMQEFEARETVRKIEERFKSQDTQHQKKLSAIKQLTSNISKNDPVIIKTYGSNDNLSDKTLEEFLSNGDKNDRKSAKMQENVENLSNFEEKSPIYEEKPAIFEGAPQENPKESAERADNYKEKSSKLPLIVGRNKVQASWLTGKDFEEYEVFIYNALLLAETLENNKNAENTEKLRDWMRKNLKESPNSREILLKTRKNYLFLERKEAFLQKIGKRFKLLQSRKAIIPAFLAFPSEKSQKLGFIQQNAKKKEKKYPFPSEVCLETAKNEKKPWIFQKTQFFSRLKLELLDRKTPIFLYFPSEGDLKKARDFMVFKALLGKKIDFLCFFKKHAISYYSAHCEPLLECIKTVVSTKKREKNTIPEERPAKRFEKPTKNAENFEKGPKLFEEKHNKIEGERPNLFEEKQEFSHMKAKEPENELNIEPKTLLRIENQVYSRETMRKLRQNAWLSLQNRKNIGLFTAKWLEAALKQGDSPVNRQITMNFAGFCVEIPQKLCFYKPILEVTVFSKKQELARKRLELRVDRKTQFSSKKSSVLKALDSSLDLNSYLSSNESVICWVCDGENLVFRVEIDENSQDLCVELGLADEGGFSLLSNFAEIQANAQQEGKFLTHTTKQRVSERNCRVYAGLRPIFSKENSDNELLDLLLMSFVTFEGEINEFPKEFQAFIDDFIEKRADISKDFVYNLPIKFEQTLIPGFFEEELVAQFLEEAQVLDFRRKFALFQGFSQEKLLKNVEKFLAFREQELVSKGYLRNCDSLNKFMGKSQNFNEIFEKLQKENSKEIDEIIANLSLKGLSNEFRSDLWKFQAKRVLLPRLREGFRQFLAKKPEFSKKIQAEIMELEGIYASVREIVSKTRENLELKADFLRDFEKTHKFRKNPQFFWEIIRVTSFVFHEILSKTFIYQENCLIILMNLSILFETSKSSCDLQENREPSAESLCFIFIYLLEGPLSRYFFAETAGFSHTVAEIQSDLTLFAEFLKERLPNLFFLFEQNRGNPLPLSQFADFFLNLCVCAQPFAFRADFLFRLWDIFSSLREIDEVSQKNSSFSRENAVSESYRVYVISVLVTIFRRTSRLFEKFRDCADFCRKTSLFCRLWDDYEEIFAEILEEAREFREFLQKKPAALCERERQMLKQAQFARKVRTVAATQLKESKNPQKSVSFCLASKENSTFMRENPLFSLENSRNSRVLHVFVHELRFFQQVSSDKTLILELSCEKTHTFHEICEGLQVEIYEKCVFQGFSREIRANLHESSQKVPENVGVSFKQSLNLLRFSTISLENINENVVFTGVFPLISKETDINFARSSIKLSILLENHENKPDYFDISAKNLQVCEEFMGFFEETEEKVRVSANSLLNSFNLLKKPQEDLTFLSKNAIISSLSPRKLAEFPVFTHESLQFLLKSMEIKQDVAVSASFSAQFLQINKPFSLENGRFFEHEALISLVLQSSGTCMQKIHTFFDYLLVNSTDFTHVSSNKVKRFLTSLYEMLGFLAFPNETDNFLDNMLAQSRETLEKVQISLIISEGFRKKYDFLDYFSMFLNKKHRFCGKKGFLFADLKFFKEILQENREKCAKIKDFFYFLEKNSQEQGFASQIWLKFTYFEGFCGKNTMKLRLSRDFTILSSNSKGNSNENVNENQEIPHVSQPLARFLWLHGYSMLLDIENLAINRETFVYLFEKLPLVRYLMGFCVGNRQDFWHESEKSKENNEKNTISLEIVVENQKICTVRSEISEKFPENSEKITENYYILANLWREKCVEAQFSAHEREKISVSAERGKIFDKELRLARLSLYLPLKLAVFSAQKAIILHFLEDFPAKIVIFPIIFQVDFLRTHIYAHFPSKTQRIDIESDLLSVFREKSEKTLILEYSTRSHSEKGSFLTLEPGLNIDFFTRNQRFFTYFCDFALFRAGNHSAQWLKARILRSLSGETSNKTREHMRNKESFVGFEVVFELFPNESFFKRPSEVIVLRNVDLFRLQCCRLKNIKVYKSFVEKPLIIEKKPANVQNPKRNEENEYAKVFETHEEDSEEMRNTPNSQYFNPEKKSLQGNSEEFSAKKIKENEGKPERNQQKLSFKLEQKQEKSEKNAELKLNTFEKIEGNSEKIPIKSKGNESFEDANRDKEEKEKKILKKLYGEEEEILERKEKNQRNSLIKLKKAFEKEEKNNESQVKIPTNNDYEDSLELENQ